MTIGRDRRREAQVRDDLVEQRVLVAARHRAALRRPPARDASSSQPVAATRRRPVSWIAEMTSAHGAYGGLASASLQRPATSAPARRRTSLCRRRIERRLADARLADDRHELRRRSRASSRAGASSRSHLVFAADEVLEVDRRLERSSDRARVAETTVSRPRRFAS